MAKDRKRILKNRAMKKGRGTARKRERARERHKRAGGQFVQMGCRRGELERAPIHTAYAADSIATQGIGNVVVARRLPDGRIAAGLFLVDAYCLGVKDAFLTVRTALEFDEVMGSVFAQNDGRHVTPAHARKLVDGAVAYARDLGFEPHPDFYTAAVVLGDIDPSQCTTEFTFGHDGKPYYVSGPHDSESKIRRIIGQLAKRCGPGGFHFLVAPGGRDAADLMDDDDEEIPF